MNTHDIELPPLPDWADRTLQGEDRDSLFAWAEAAIEADRKRQGDSAKVLAELVALIPLADTLNASASCQDLIDYFKGVIADRKRRGEPVGRNARDAIHGLQGSIAVGSDGEWVSIRRDARDTAIQRLRELSDDCAHLYESYRMASDRADRSRWPTDAMVVLGAEVLHDGLRSLGVDLDEDFRGTTLEQGIAESVFSSMMDLAPQPSEPVVRNSRNTSEPVKVPSEGELAEFMWQHADEDRTIPPRHFAIAARALLARYGKGTP